MPAMGEEANHVRSTWAEIKGQEIAGVVRERYEVALFEVLES
jgi:hypothetical protein